MTRRSSAAPGDPVAVGTELELEVGPVAHGGHCVARHEGLVVFVRHTLPGERVRALVTSRHSSFLRADAVAVLRAAPGRVQAPCRYARPGGCGGCDWQHADLATQRTLKAQVVAEQLRRLAGLDLEVTVEEVPGAARGLGWRTRERFAVDPASARAGLRRHRSHDVLPLDTCLLAHQGVLGTGVLAQHWPGVAEVQVTASASTGEVSVLVDGVPRGRRRVRETAVGRTWLVSAAGFWQVHPGAADVLTRAVHEALQPGSGEHAIDLYSGVGLFAGLLATEVGPTGRVDAVESDPAAARDARRNLHDLPQAHLYESSVDAWLAQDSLRGCDLVVLDPPRSGAGARVVAGISKLGARAVAYVACDPAALARDIRAFAGHGWRLAGLRAFDLFPMTHHVECVARLLPVVGSGRD